MKPLNNVGAFIIATVVLYSTEHWIGATVLLTFLILGVVGADGD